LFYYYYPIVYYNVTKYTIQQPGGVENEGEISEIYPPFNKPFMFATEQISFKIISANGKTYSFVEAAPGHSPGLVAINQIFPVYGLNVFTATSVKQLTQIGTNTFGIPVTRLVPGSEYELIIQSNTFKDPDGNVLFGPRPFRYRFRTYALSVDSLGSLTAGITQLTIHGKNFDLFNPGVLIDNKEIAYKTVEFNFGLSLSGGDCALQPTYSDVSHTDTEIQINNLDLHGCTIGKLQMSLELKRNCTCIRPTGYTCADVSKNLRVDDTSFFIKGEQLVNYPIGNFGCEDNCLNCQSTGNHDCYICKPETLVLVNGKCMETCPVDIPMKFTKYVFYAGKLYEQPYCLSGCPEGKYEYKTNNGSLCALCDSACYACKGPGIRDCIKCPAGKYLWEGTCIMECPSHQVDSYGNCVPVTGNITTQLVDITVRGASLNNFITGANDVVLMMRLLNTKFRLVSSQWNKLPADPIGGVQLFQNLTDVNTTVAIIRKEYIEQMPTGALLTIGLRAFIENITNPLITGEVTDVVTLVKREPITQGNYSIYPLEGTTQSTWFTMTFYNWTILNGTNVEVWADYTPRVLLMETIINEGATISLKGFRVPHWGLLQSTETKRIDLIFIAKFAGQQIRMTIPITLTNNYTKSTATENLKQAAANEITSDDNAMLASSLLANIAPSVPQISYCKSNADCSFHGDCISKKCECKPGWFGSNCAMDEKLQPQMTNISEKIGDYLKYNFIYSGRQITSTSVGVFATIVGNLGKTPDLIDKYMVDGMTDYLKRAEQSMTPDGVGEMGKEKVGSFVQAGASLLKIKSNELDKKVQDSNGNLNTRKQAADKIEELKGTMNNMLGKAAQILPPNDQITVEDKDFEAKVGVFYKKDLSLPNRTAVYSLGSSGAGVDVPPSIFVNGPVELKEMETANIRMMRWNGNPYNFAKKSTLVKSDVVGFSFLNSTGGEVDVKNLIEPILIKIPIPVHLKDRQDLKCVYYDENAETTYETIVEEEVNVNELNMTDAEKRLQFPEWKPEIYRQFPLIAKHKVIKNVTEKVGDFKGDGCSFRGLDGNNIVCACTHLSDFAVQLDYPDTPEGDTVVPIPYNDYSANRNVFLTNKIILSE